jgi:hypothetical protein
LSLKTARVAANSSVATLDCGDAAVDGCTWLGPSVPGLSHPTANVKVTTTNRTNLTDLILISLLTNVVFEPRQYTVRSTTSHQISPKTRLVLLRPIRGSFYL